MRCVWGFASPALTATTTNHNSLLYFTAITTGHFSCSIRLMLLGFVVDTVDGGGMVDPRNTTCRRHRQRHRDGCKKTHTQTHTRTHSDTQSHRGQPRTQNQQKHSPNNYTARIKAKTTEFLGLVYFDQCARVCAVRFCDFVYVCVCSINDKRGPPHTRRQSC